MSVVVPTFREAAGLAALVERLVGALAGCGWEWELLLVDDDSDDGTERIVGELTRTAPVRLHVRRGVARDLSRSVLLGIRLARFDRVVVMDADLSHPPERIARLLAALDAGAELALGSRYGAGGSVDPSWSPPRRLGSRLATALARPLVSCGDPLSGFFAVDRRILPAADRLRPGGYKIALELMVRGRLRVAEVPIDFRDRSTGASKMNLRVLAAYLGQLARLYAFRVRRGSGRGRGQRRVGRFARRLAAFGAVGASGFALDVACYVGLQWVGLDHRLARAISFWPAVTWNWFANRRVTFGDFPPDRRVPQWGRFVLASLAGLIANAGGYAALTTFLPWFDAHRWVALVAGVGLGAILNFALAAGYVFRAEGAAVRDGARRRGSDEVL